jgi:DNA repair exonuclease SbcCD ATPase subunit
MKTIQQLRNTLEQQKGKRNQTEETVLNLRKSIRQDKQRLHAHEHARAVIQEVAEKTQAQLQYHISDITSLALEAVFDDPYELLVEFVQRRNKTECDLWFVRDGNRLEPLSATGGGAVDAAAFALRIASWSMQRPHSRNVIIMDEPLRFLSEDMQEQASQMIQEISRRLHIQFIIVTHESVLASYADKVFETYIKNGVTKFKN